MLGSVGYERLMSEVVSRARNLLGRELCAHGVTIVITEVEAYGGIHDPASHAFVRTPRSETMYGPPWRLYVYRIHGHYSANIVTGPTESAAAVLLRAGRVISGSRIARERRGDVDEEHLARGPGNLAKALGITMDDLGVNVLESESVRLGPEVPKPGVPAYEIYSGPRVGVRKAADWPWRLWLANERSVSAYRRHPQAESTQGPMSGELSV